MPPGMSANSATSPSGSVREPVEIHRQIQGHANGHEDQSAQKSPVRRAASRLGGVFKEKLLRQGWQFDAFLNGRHPFLMVQGEHLLAFPIVQINGEHADADAHDNGGEGNESNEERFHTGWLGWVRFCFLGRLGALHNRRRSFIETLAG